MYSSYITASELTRPISPKPPELWPLISIPHSKIMRATNANAVTTALAATLVVPLPVTPVQAEAENVQGVGEHAWNNILTPEHDPSSTDPVNIVNPPVVDAEDGGDSQYHVDMA